MRMKIVVLSLLATVGFMSAHAMKPIQMGIKGGLTWQTVDYRGAKAGDYRLYSDPRMGTQLGVVARINLLMLHVQPELLYSMDRYELNVEPADGVGGDLKRSRSIVKVNSFELPVLFGVKLLMVRLNAGPVFNLSNEVSVKSKSGSAHTVTAVKSTIGYAAGVGLDLGKWSIDARYSGQFRRPLQTVQIMGLDKAYDFRTNFGNWAFTLSYLF